MVGGSALADVWLKRVCVILLGDWLAEFYPGLQTLPAGSHARPMECIQQAGELLYVPEGWYHATVNLGDTVITCFPQSRVCTSACLLTRRR